MDFAPYRHLVQLALTEDLDDAGDVTSAALFTDEVGSATLVSKADGVLAGAGMFDLVLHEVDGATRIDWGLHDGDKLERGIEVAVVRGMSAAILSAERTALNFLAFLSGIATATHRYVEAAQGGAVVLDTRKTLPGFRQLSKYAVTVGGGTNHRMGLYDMVMLKDNHIDLCGSISEAVQRVRDRWGIQYRIEVECRNEADVADAVEAGADVVMLDNMGLEATTLIAERYGERIELEASGNVNLDTIGKISSTGVKYVSVGRITHSVESFDFSLKESRRE